MIVFQNSSLSNVAVTAFMRWPISTSLLAAAMWVAPYVSENTEEASSGPCSKFCSRACDLSEPSSVLLPDDADQWRATGFRNAI